jgi:ubiquinone biosynthesis accessory factor UbiJ
MPATPVWLAAVESILNRGIIRSQKAETAARRLSGTSLQVDVEGFVRIQAAVLAERLALGAPTAEAVPGAVISGSPRALLGLLREGAGRTSSSNRTGAAAVRISGDAELAARYRELFALAAPDLEDELSRLVGDLPARRLSIAVQGAAGWLRKAGRTARENVAEYLQEESRDLVGGAEVEEFARGVDGLRDTAERIEARLARLEQRLKSAAP